MVKDDNRSLASIKLKNKILKGGKKNQKAAIAVNLFS